MHEVLLSAGENRVAPSSATRTGNLTLAETVNLYMAAYTGRDDSRPQRLRFWAQALGDRRLVDLTDDDVFDVMKRLEGAAGRYYAGLDADGRPIMRAKRRPLTPATLNRYEAALAAVLTWAIKRRMVPRGWAHPCKTLEQRPENNERVRFLSDDERDRLFVTCRASKYRWA